MAAMMSKRTLHVALLTALMSFGCSSSDAKPQADAGEDAGEDDAGENGGDGGADAGTDAGTGNETSLLPRPGLPRPPAAGKVPAELRPPR